MITNSISSYRPSDFYPKISNNTKPFAPVKNAAVPAQSFPHPMGRGITKGTLYCGDDILASVGGVGGEVHVKYDESTTEEDPVVIAWGKDSHGNPYEEKIHLNDVNPNDASPAEMIALNAHLAKTGAKTDAGEAGPGAFWGLGCRYDVNTKINYTQIYNDYIAMQEQGKHNSNTALYQLELERFLFFNQPKKTE